MYSKTTVYVTGTSKLSRTDPIMSNYDIFFVGLVIDRLTDKIVDSTCNMVKETTENFIKSILNGYNIVSETGKLEDEIRMRFHGMAQKSIIAAVKDARNKYVMLREQGEQIEQEEQ